ncbi:MAG: A/G-specific adenine glycosylase [Flavobacteriales bacterium]|nr:A/G-specific adenine glycosylase [Flavobacteriales bacterium]MBK7942496.1 A/G-specific adenine glycosylase [Flavobacteriales bacterium]MBK9699104.1 A/G-specific adenine glycosylase [Flavobacteriales bacterium]
MSSRSWFSKALRGWYAAGHRDLPWRRTRDPYRIWLSEVILQQTRIDQGTAYYERFVEQYPTVQQLASAPDDDVMRLWQGLGYYSRARNLLQAARSVVTDHGGRFPDTVDDLRALKGVGDYTAAAIASIAFDRPAAVVDGNVYRVLARVVGISTPIDPTAGRRAFAALADDLLDAAHPGDHNQAVMELGATVCLPRAPRCGECPVASRCVARREDRIGELPVKAGRTTVRERHFNYLCIDVEGGLVLRKREGRDIWQGLYEPPLLESEAPLELAGFREALHDRLGAGWDVTGRNGPVRHVLSHQVLHARFWSVTPPRTFVSPPDWRFVPANELDRFAVPRPIERYLLQRRSKDLFA